MTSNDCSTDPVRFVKIHGIAQTDGKKLDKIFPGSTIKWLALLTLWGDSW